MRYYHDEHEAAYRQIERLDYTQWNDLFDDRDEWTFDHFQNRPLLERIIPHLGLPAPSATQVFEYGCGTGPAACYLAAHGFQVEAIDFIPEAIAIARRMAEERGVHVAFGVADVCDLAAEPVTGRYDLVLDSFCLQSIVTEQDRASVYSAVRARLKPNGYYLISTAIRSPGRGAEPGHHFDAARGILYREAPACTGTDAAVEIDGRWFIPHRRHLSADALREELVSAGFQMLSLESTASPDVVCRLV